MFGSTILDVVIGLFFLYLFLSLVCSTVNEWIARAFSLRARTLENGIRKLFAHPDDRGLTEEFYKHPLIRALLHDGSYKRPSFIPSATFVTTLLDIISSGSPEPGPAGIEGLRAAVKKFPDCHDNLKKALLAMLDEAGYTMDRARSNIEKWFDGVMETVAIWYKRRVQLIIIVIALSIGWALNADTFMFSNMLWYDSTLRSMFVKASEVISSETATIDNEELLKGLDKALKELEDSRIPLGWSTKAGDPRRLPRTFYGWLKKTAGILITGLCITLGAPFWFDLLKKIVRLRPAPADAKKG